MTRAGEEVVDHGMLYGMSAADARARGQHLFEQLDLEGLWTRQPRAMSGGPAPPARHRHGPDPRADPGLPRRADHRASTRRRAPTCGSTSPTCATRRGATVFLTTHYLDEADALSDRIVIIDHGRIVASDTADNLKAAVAGDLVELEVATRRAGEHAPPRSSPRSSATSDGVEVDGHQVQRPRPPGRRGPCRACCATSTAPGSSSTSIEVRRPTLDDVFLDLTGRSLRES